MRVSLFLAGLALVLVYAMWKGGGPERAVGLVLIGMGVGSVAAHQLIPHSFMEIDQVFLATDLLALVALLIVALRAKRLWPLCVGSLQTISFVAHLARALDYSIHPIAYAIMAVGPSYPIIALLALGTWRHQRRLRLCGSDPSWRDSSRPSPTEMRTT